MRDKTGKGGREEDRVDTMTDMIQGNFCTDWHRDDVILQYKTVDTQKGWPQAGPLV